MARYICGPTPLQLSGHEASVQWGQSFEHDFSEAGPEGEHGPAREAALLACGALTLAPEEMESSVRPSRRRTSNDNKE